ncbi:ATP synthase [Nesidiocoris tenuis]|uniref:ATP synthase n=1 Tax=Nesidiocoris tenuis TaxID=355587 RepID=A0ABN7AMM0_9HEMI|nr:ATP synthase [Nesidiocoris tenuis]
MLFKACKLLIPRPTFEKRTFFGALNAIFNSVSTDRIKQVGPDRACAEWLMRNGAHIRWLGQEDFVAHYNSLPLDPEEHGSYHIEEIFARDATISHHGFPHLRGCNYIKRISLIRCAYLTDRCIEQLTNVHGSLLDVDIRDCQELTKNGLLKLGEINLENLRSIRIGSMLEPTELDDVVLSLQKRLPKVSVELMAEEQN